MTESRWRRQARNVIRRVLAELPADASEADKRRAVSAAYPFWERAHHPYKMFLAEVRAQLGGRVRKEVESDMVKIRLLLGIADGLWTVYVDCGWCCRPPIYGCIACRTQKQQAADFRDWPEWQAWQRAMSEDASAAGPCSDWLEENGWGDLAAQLRAMTQEVRGC
jgi:hypothetical protein